MRRLLILRPEPGASTTLERARQLGLEALKLPLFEIEPLAWEAPDPTSFDGLLLTSANAARHGGEQLARLRQLPVYAVGRMTARCARDAGFEVTAIGEGGVDDLLGSIAANLKLLHLCGEHHRTSPFARQKIAAMPVYRARALNPDLAAAERSVALVHSPRAGEQLGRLVQARGSIAIAAISKAAADAAGTGWKTVEFASEPNDDALLALAARLCNIPPQE
jgi:uroporphyrinogen-III synthase